MKGYELNLVHRAQSNYGSDVYDVILHKPMTVYEFIREMLEDNNDEWGCIDIDEWLHTVCKYDHGMIKGDFPLTIANRTIVDASAMGSWGQMNYLLKLKKEEKEN